MMTFSVEPAEIETAAAIAVVCVVLLGVLEWRRPNRLHQAWRVFASVLAVFALALLGLHPAWRQPAKNAAGIVAGVWTPGDASDAPDPALALDDQIALPGAMAAPPGAIVFPDAATLRRRFPAVATVHVFGDGLDAGDLDALNGVRIVFHPSHSATSERPSIRFLRVPHQLPLGEPLVVEGAVSGLPAGATPTLTLAGPDGSNVETVASPADAAGNAAFVLRANPPAATGRLLWRLRLMPSGEAESFGVAVVKPELPRILVLESSPHFDTADLRRWFANAGGKLWARTLVGQGRYRFASSTPGVSSEFATVDAHLLADFDLLVIDAAALAALTPPERGAVSAAVTDTGLGVLTLADEAPLPTALGHALFPWLLVPEGEATTGDGEHLARPVWTGQSKAIAIPLPVEPFTLAPIAEASDLIRDGQGRSLAAVLARGRGQLALTLLHDSGRWLRSNDPGAFDAYWSFLFSRLARPIDPTTGPGRWMIAAGDDGPIFAGQPVTLLWSGATSGNPCASVLAASGSTQNHAILELGRDPAEPSRWRGTFWPQHAGWYTIATPEGGAGESLDFYVADSLNWRGVAANRRRLATARFALGSSPATARGPTTAKGNTAIPAICFFALFLGSAGFLWAERRLSV